MGWKRVSHVRCQLSRALIAAIKNCSWREVCPIIIQEMSICPQKHFSMFSLFSLSLFPTSICDHSSTCMHLVQTRPYKLQYQRILIHYYTLRFGVSKFYPYPKPQVIQILRKMVSMILDPLMHGIRKM